MRDPYLVLGLGRTASAEDLKQAYRRLAKQYHPDLNPGRGDIEQRFKEVSAAYTLLSDPEKRARYDRGELDASGNERHERPFYRSWGRGGGAGPGGAGAGAGEESFSTEDLFADFFSGNRRKAGAGGAGAGARARGSDISYAVSITFVEATLGAKRRISLSSGKSIDVAIPPGTEDQQKLRLKGQGMAGPGGGLAGDAIIEVHVEPHPFFTRVNKDLHVDIPVSLPEAVLGATIKVPTIDGYVQLKVPPGSNTGTLLRLKGKGVPDQKTRQPGDQYVKLKVVLPDPPDPELTQFLEKWARERSYDVRRKAGVG